MTQEEKQLLLKDLWARLLYKVKVNIKLPNHTEKIFEDHVGDLIEITKYGGYLVNSKGIDYRGLTLDILPYLRPMSSMTEEEYKEYYNISYGINNIGSKYKYYDLCDWFNKHHFDYRGLIEKGLAIEAPVGIYKLD